MDSKRVDLAIEHTERIVMTDYSELRAECLARFVGHDYVSDGPLVFVWHIKHGGMLDTLFEPIVNRVDYIIAEKPEHEIETRLNWLRPVKGNVPPALSRAWDALNKARAAWRNTLGSLDKASVAWDKARAAFGKAWVACKPELEKLHAAELPGCPWNWDGLIFPVVEITEN